MDTRVVPADNKHLSVAVESFRNSEPVVLPTETVYGLAAPITDERAVRRVFEIKGRPADNPLIVHINTFEQLHALTKELPGYTEELFDAFWPGPLTIIARAKRPHDAVTAGRDTIAVRMPAHPFIQLLIDEAGPLAAPSANLSGKPSPTTAEHCVQDLDGTVGVIFDGGPGLHGVESTVIDVTSEKPVILRPGVITQDMLEDVARTPFTRYTDTSGKSPGTKYAHYQPDARVLLAQDPDALDASSLGRVLVVSPQQPSYPCTHIPLPTDPQDVAKHLYAWLRRADKEGFDTIVITPPQDVGVGSAVRDRLLRAAKHS